jgi:hypothetical protein
MTASSKVPVPKSLDFPGIEYDILAMIENGVNAEHAESCKQTNV